MRRINITLAAITTGISVAFWQAIWAIIVILGGAKSILSLILMVHLGSPTAELAHAGVSAAIGAIAVAFCAGSLTGALFALVWNWLAFKQAPRWARDTHKPPASERRI